MPKDNSNKSIRIKVRMYGSKTSELEFKIYHYSTIQKLANIYCESLDLCLEDVIFNFKGSQLNETDTLMSLNMKDGDTIQVIKIKRSFLDKKTNNQIQLKVMTSADSAIEFKILRNEPLKKLMNVYCDRMNIHRKKTSFLYDGACIQDMDTASSLNMDEGDRIEVVNMFGNSKKNLRNTEYITLKVLGQDDSIVRFKVLRHQPLEKLMDSYSEYLLISRRELRFRFDGNMILSDDTPISHSMQNNDTIEVYQQVSCG